MDKFDKDIEQLIQEKIIEIQTKEKIEKYKKIEKQIEEEAHLRIDTAKLNIAIQTSDLECLRILAGECFYSIPCWVDDDMICYKCMFSGSTIYSIKEKARQEYINLLEKGN